MCLYWYQHGRKWYWMCWGQRWTWLCVVRRWYKGRGLLTCWWRRHGREWLWSEWKWTEQQRWVLSWYKSSWGERRRLWNRTQVSYERHGALWCKGMCRQHHLILCGRSATWSVQLCAHRQQLYWTWLGWCGGRRDQWQKCARRGCEWHSRLQRVRAGCSCWLGWRMEMRRQG